MAEFTLLEIHLDGAEFTANAPFTGGKSKETTGSRRLSFGGSGDTDADEGLGGDEGGSSPLLSILGFVGLILLVVLVRRILGGSGEPVVED